MLIENLSTKVGNEWTWFKAYVDYAIERLLARGVQISTSGSAGGYLSVFEPNPYYSPRIEELIACGSFPFEKCGRYMYNSTEKAVRLNGHLKDGHKTSRESANEAAEEYPGAVWFASGNRIFSFSGLEPIWDEFISVLVSCFSHRRQEYPLYVRLEDIPALFKQRMRNIPATSEQAQIMIEVVDEVVSHEIKLRDKD